MILDTGVMETARLSDGVYDHGNEVISSKEDVIQ